MGRKGIQFPHLFCLGKADIFISPTLVCVTYFQFQLRVKFHVHQSRTHCKPGDGSKVVFLVNFWGQYLQNGWYDAVKAHQK